MDSPDRNLSHETEGRWLEGGDDDDGSSSGTLIAHSATEEALYYSTLHLRRGLLLDSSLSSS